jgi:hypothetical protein
MKKKLHVTLEIEVETDLTNIGDVVDSLTFNVTEDDENVEVKDSEVVDYFEV